MLVYFLRGTLPWRKIKGATVAETWDAIRDKKLEAASVLTVGLPVEFEIFFNYARGLEFEDLPDYVGLRDLFKGPRGGRRRDSVKRVMRDDDGKQGGGGSILATFEQNTCRLKN